jgi:predicted nucleotide-binding protein (sugar kinase/HSP70/actin superfamily)
MKLFTRKFTSIPVKRTPKPLVGVTGEIYVRQHHFSNNNIVKTLESLGAEVEVATTAEWFFYVNRRQKEDSVADRDWRSFFKVCVKNWWQRKCEHKVIMNAKEGIPHAEEPTIEELFEYSNPYLYQAVEGEAVLTIGKCIDFIKKGVDGLVTVMPFTCMPGTNVSAIMHKVKEEYNIPYINMSYDGLEQATASTRLEAFMGQVHQHMKKKKE